MYTEDKIADGMLESNPTCKTIYLNKIKVIGNTTVIVIVWFESLPI
jgi:hypothetical protein